MGYGMAEVYSLFKYTNRYQILCILVAIKASVEFMAIRSTMNDILKSHLPLLATIQGLLVNALPCSSKSPG